MTESDPIAREGDRTGSTPGSPVAAQRADPRAPGVRMWEICVLVLGAIAAAGISYALASQGSDEDGGAPTVAVTRGVIRVTVTEGGDIQALESLKIKNRVEGRPAIVELIDEGTVLTEQDVEDGTILAELDSSEVADRESRRRLSFYRAEADRHRAQEDLLLRRNQNESDIALAELNVKFARIDLERYLSTDLAADVTAESDFGALAGDERLGGVARQELQELQDALRLAEAQLANQAEELRHAEGLAEDGYIQGRQLTSTRIKHQQLQVALESAKEELHLFTRYTLAKEAEQLHSDLIEAARRLARVQARARSELAQAEAELLSTGAAYDLEKTRLDRDVEMLANCVIRAPAPGRVVYASRSRRHRRRRRRIEKGATVRQNQTIFIIPDLDSLATSVNIHETDIHMMKLGQRALVTVEALPGLTLPARVAEISPVASAADAHLNPDLKVYEVNVALDEVPEVLTIGMTATAEIIVADLEDVLMLPIGAVVAQGESSVCFVPGPMGPEVREVETGYSTATHVEIRSGLSEGELVLKNAREGLDAGPPAEGGQ